jgi:predicted nucleic acid-binding protein
MIIVSYTSPVTSLLSIGRIELLQSLFGTVVIPSEVRSELLQFHANLPAFLECRPVEDEDMVETLCLELDRGEAEAIVLAKELEADYLLMDESIGRRVASRESLTVVGVVGVQLLAKERAFIPSVREVMDELRSKAGFYLGDVVRAAVLAEAGE